MTYEVRYKMTNSYFWRTIKRVKGDGLLETRTHRFFILEDETRIEIPLIGTQFKFEAARFLSIKKNMELEVGHPLVTRS